MSLSCLFERSGIISKSLPFPLLVCCSIILASKFDPIKLLPRLLPYLNPSCPFVVFSDYLEVRPMGG